jgi:DNA gyrase subunit A
MGKIMPTFLEDELRKSYLDYAMSVIISRAIPDIRDGLKPVQRRILFAMYNLGLLSRSGYRKSAKISGEVTANYHPHGTVPVYEALVRMAQFFSYRYPLIDGQGNFGSQDGDPPAAERYTEARLSRIAEELLEDIDKDTVDFVPNYDNSTTEPSVLPTRIPNLLLNGATGIAVGMATNIPPHNIKELIDAIIAFMENPSLDPEKLAEIIPGPDFPTGGVIVGQEGILDYYRTGYGRFILRGKVEIDESIPAIIIKEIPYQVNKANLVKHIAELSQKNRIEGIVGLRDESDRHGIQVVIEVNKEPQIILNQLYKYTQLQITYGTILLALVNGEPKVLNLPQIIELFLEHRRDVIIRRTKYEKLHTEKRLHILEGLRIALSALSEVISIIRKATDVNKAKQDLIARFELSPLQAQAILDMRLSSLSRLEQNKLNEEYTKKSSYLKELEEILASPEKVNALIKGELEEIKKNYGDKRYTQIIKEKERPISYKELILKEDVAVLITKSNYIKRLPLSSYRTQRRGTIGITTTKLKSEDFASFIVVCSSHDTLLLFSNLGRCYTLPAYEIPQESRTQRGKHISSLLNLKEKEEIVAILPLFEEEEISPPEIFLQDALKSIDEVKSIIFISEQGKVKRVRASAFFKIRGKQGIRALKLQKNDRLISVLAASKGEDLFIATEKGKLIRFPVDSLRFMGRGAAGVRGIRLKNDDRAVGATVAKTEMESENIGIFTLSTLGYGKTSPISVYRRQRRAGSGIISMKITKNTGPLCKISTLFYKEEILILTQKGIVLRIRGKELPILGRSTVGVKLIKLKENDRVVTFTLIPISLENNGTIS